MKRYLEILLISFIFLLCQTNYAQEPCTPGQLIYSVDYPPEAQIGMKDFEQILNDSINLGNYSGKKLIVIFIINCQGETLGYKALPEDFPFADQIFTLFKNNLKWKPAQYNFHVRNKLVLENIDANMAISYNIIDGKFRFDHFTGMNQKKKSKKDRK
jgi:hypothetical protein